MTGPVVHGTPTGYHEGCKTRVGCPAVISCREVYTRYRSDLTFKRAIDAGTPLEEIVAADQAAAVADALAVREARRAEMRKTHAPRPAKRTQPSGRSRVPWTAKDSAVLAELAALGMSVSQIAASMHRGTSTVRGQARLAGVELRDGRAGRTIPRPGPVQASPVVEVLHGTIEGYEAGCFTVDCPASPSCADVNLMRVGVLKPAKERVERVVKPHGTNAAYARGCQVHEECPNFGVEGAVTCYQAMRTYHREYIAKRRAAGVPAEKHGTAYGYQLGCRNREACPAEVSCTDVMVAADREHARRRGVAAAPEMVDAGPVREHVRELMAAKVGILRIAERAEVGKGTIAALLYGRAGETGRRNQGLQKSISRERAERIMAVQP